MPPLDPLLDLPPEPLLDPLLDPLLEPLDPLCPLLDPAGVPLDPPLPVPLDPPLDALPTFVGPVPPGPTAAPDPVPLLPELPEPLLPVEAHGLGEDVEPQPVVRPRIAASKTAAAQEEVALRTIRCCIGASKN
jgi:hypothetical protein